MREYPGEFRPLEPADARDKATPAGGDARVIPEVDEVGECRILNDVVQLADAAACSLLSSSGGTVGLDVALPSLAFCVLCCSMRIGIISLEILAIGMGHN